MGVYRFWGVIIVLLGMWAGYFLYTSETNPESRFPFRLGLDLAGGALLTYEADTNSVSDAEVEGAMNALRDVVERRVNLFGVSEPSVQVEKAGESDRLIVELPGVTDLEEAVAQLGATPVLEFKLLDSNISFTDLGSLEDGAEEDFYIDTGLTGRFLQRARVDFGGGGHGGGIGGAIVALEFNDEGSELFRQITTDHIGEVLAIFLDGVPVTQPVIQTTITNGQAVITGSFTPEEARDIARDLNFGALPVPIELVSTQSIGASLGEETAQAGLQAGLWGLALVALFMIFWYRLPGVIAIVALTVYVVLMMVIFKVVPVTLTAAGIAGFILSIGMAVDANVLIFERLKEELGAGKPLRDAIREGFRRAWLSIRDGNLTSIFTAIILFYTTTSLVKGFALTFGIGVLLSMLSAITVTRTLLLAVAPGDLNKLFESGFKNFLTPNP